MIFLSTFDDRQSVPALLVVLYLFIYSPSILQVMKRTFTQLVWGIIYFSSPQVAAHFVYLHNLGSTVLFFVGSLGKSKAFLVQWHSYLLRLSDPVVCVKFSDSSIAPHHFTRNIFTSELLRSDILEDSGRQEPQISCLAYFTHFGSFLQPCFERLRGI